MAAESSVAIGNSKTENFENSVFLQVGDDQWFGWL